MLKESFCAKFAVEERHLLAAALHPKYRELRQFSFLSEEERVDVRAALTRAVGKEVAATSATVATPSETAQPSRVRSGVCG